MRAGRLIRPNSLGTLKFLTEFTSMSKKSLRALILAAGASEKFFRPLYDKPKGLFQFKGELLIERQIRQLRKAGVAEIAVVLGYEKEQYFYLEEKYGVELFINEKATGQGNLGSLLTPPRKFLDNSFICNADHWYEENPFLGFSSDRSVRMVSPAADARREFVVSQGADGRLSCLRSGAAAGLSLCGFAYFTKEFAQTLLRLYAEEKDWLGVCREHWEQFWGRHTEELPLYGIAAPEEWREFDSLADLQAEDQGVLCNVSHDALENICGLLQCHTTDIYDIQPLNRGLTNVSFSFFKGSDKYVYRYPGYSSSNLVNRSAEVLAQNEAVSAGIDTSVIDIGESGWKLSRYVQATRTFDYSDETLLAESIRRIRAFHARRIPCTYEVNLLTEGDRLLALAANKKGKLAERYRELRGGLEKLWHYTELDGVEKVLCHNDVYAVNWLVGEKELCLIDWEYAGVNDPVNDIATAIVRDSLPDDVTEKMLTLFYDRPPTLAERRHAYAIFAMCGWYWYCWCLFKDTLGEDGFFMLPSWRAVRKYLPLALSFYEKQKG